VCNRWFNFARHTQFVNFYEDLAGAVEGVFQPKVGGEGRVSGGGDDAILEGVAFLESENANGFDADVLIGGKFFDGGIGGVGDGAGEEFGGAPVGVANADERDFDLLEGAVVVESDASEFASAENVVELDDGVDVFAGVAVGFEADMSFEELDLEGELGVVLRFGGGFFWSGGRGFLRFLGEQRGSGE